MSLVASMTHAEIAVVGNDGIVGISLFMRGESRPSRPMIQSGDAGLPLQANSLMQACNRPDRCCTCYCDTHTHAPLTHPHRGMQPLSVARSAAVALAPAEPGTLQSNQLVMTQELNAHARRASRRCHGSAESLHRAGIIDCQRGHITVLNRALLAQRSCECYVVVKKEYDRLLPTKMAS